MRLILMLLLIIVPLSSYGGTLLSIYQQKVTNTTYQIVLLSNEPLAWKIEERDMQNIKLFLPGTNNIKMVENIFPLQLKTNCQTKGCYLNFEFPESVFLENVKFRYLHSHALAVYYDLEQ